MKRTNLILSAVALALAVACEPVDHVRSDDQQIQVEAEDVARILSELSLGPGQYAEVYDAVTSSSDNGYDEEYTMRDLFKEPGSGVGDAGTKASRTSYERPMRDLIAEYLSSTKASSYVTKAGPLPKDYIDELMSSDVQIYWPYSESWDGVTPPIITFDPDDGSETSKGYRTTITSFGNRVTEEVTVTEELAMETPVWVVNRNTDSDFKTLEMLRKENPEWGAGGVITIGGTKPQNTGTKAGDSSEDKVLRTLILKQFTSHRNFDNWLAGASEFFIKTGAVEDFSASTEAELQLYDPSITDFVVVVKRGKVGLPIHFNAVLVSQWSDQLTSCAFMIHEDDGGSRTSWKCSAEVKIKSKTTGFDIEIPFRTRDDIVWRGQLSRAYLEKYSGKTGHFGDVDIKFEIVEL